MSDNRSAATAHGCICDARALGRCPGPHAPQEAEAAAAADTTSSDRDDDDYGSDNNNTASAAAGAAAAAGAGDKSDARQGAAVQCGSAAHKAGAAQEAPEEAAPLLLATAPALALGRPVRGIAGAGGGLPAPLQQQRDKSHFSRREMEQLVALVAQQEQPLGHDSWARITGAYNSWAAAAPGTCQRSLSTEKSCGGSGP
eukprot:m51a1_g5730 hypothetical protein (199) ;mRNA; f:1130470-1131605